MEKLAEIIRGKQSGESTAVELATKQSLSVASLRQLGTMLQQMSAAFPHQEVAPETAEVFYMTFEELARKHGMKNLETALRSFLTRQKFFPHPSEVAEELEAMQKRAEAEAVKSLPKIGCDVCKDGPAVGLILVIEMGRRYVKPCECRLKREKAKNALESGR